MNDFYILVSFLVAIPFYFRVTCNKERQNRYYFFWVAIPFYFRVTCNPPNNICCGIHTWLPYPSIFGSLATETCSPFGYSSLCCHTLLFSGHLQHLMPLLVIPKIQVAIPFYFRVTCNRHFFRLDWLKTYLSIPRFSRILSGSILSLQYLKK